MEIQLPLVYSILKNRVSKEEAKVLTYSELSTIYCSLTGYYPNPHGSWDAVLGTINNMLYLKGAPAISALVMLKGKNQPGDGFWGCAPNVPIPKNHLAKIDAWVKILEEIRCFNWKDIEL